VPRVVTVTMGDQKLPEKKTIVVVEKGHDHPDFPPFHHWKCCGKDLFSYSTAIGCPACKKPLELKEMKQTWQAPFGPAKPRSIAVRMTVGRMKNYSADCLLHTGISDTSGDVYNFDQAGRRVDTPAKWGSETISIPLHHDALSNQQWDKAIEEFLREEQEMAAFKPYEALGNNCYTFVLIFLNKIRYEGRSNHSKDEMVVRFIQKPIDDLDAFISITRQLQKDKVVVYKPASKVTAYSCDFCGVVIPSGQHYRCAVCKDTDLCDKCFAAKRENRTHKNSHLIHKCKD